MKRTFTASAALCALLVFTPATLAQTPEEPAAPPPAEQPAAPAPTAAPTAAEVDAKLTELFGDAAAYKTFLADLQKATAEEDKKAVTAMVSYPFTTKVEDKDVTFDKAADLEKAYDDVFTPKILLAIKNQTYETLFANAQGVMIGSGQVWFSGVGEGADAAVKIIAINQHAGS